MTDPTRYRLLSNYDGHHYVVPAANAIAFLSLSKRAANGDTDAEFEFHTRFHSMLMTRPLEDLTFTEPRTEL